MFNLIKGINFIFINEDEVIETRENLQDPFELGKTITGMKKSNDFIPLSCSNIGHKLISEGTNVCKFFNFKIKYVKKFNHESVKCLSYVTFILALFW